MREFTTINNSVDVIVDPGDGKAIIGLWDNMEPGVNEEFEGWWGDHYLVYGEDYRPGLKEEIESDFESWVQRGIEYEIEQERAIQTNAVLGRAMQRVSMVSAAQVLDDTGIAMLQPITDNWRPGHGYLEKEPVQHEGKMYQVMQAHTSQEHQPPGSAGMLAIYRPVDAEEHKGTIADPIPFVYGMDCLVGKYYSYEGHTYLCKGDMIPCVWTPGSPGVHQWEMIA